MLIGTETATSGPEHPISSHRSSSDSSSCSTRSGYPATIAANVRAPRIAAPASLMVPHAAITSVTQIISHAIVSNLPLVALPLHLWLQSVIAPHPLVSAHEIRRALNKCNEECHRIMAEALPQHHGKFTAAHLQAIENTIQRLMQDTIRRYQLKNNTPQITGINHDIYRAKLYTYMMLGLTTVYTKAANLTDIYALSERVHSIASRLEDAITEGDIVSNSIIKQLSAHLVRTASNMLFTAAAITTGPL